MFVGTLYPLALEALTGEKISVGAPFFNLTFGPLFMPLLIAVPFGPLLAWKRGDLAGAAQRLIWRGGAWALALAAVFAIQRGGPVLAPFGIGLAVYVMVGALIDPIERVGLFRVPLGVALPARAACRARPGARRSRISPPGCCCSASSPRASGMPSASSR